MKLTQFDLARFPNLRRSGGEKVGYGLDQLESRQSTYPAVCFLGLPTTNTQSLQVTTVVPQEGPPPKSDLFIHCLAGSYWALLCSRHCAGSNSQTPLSGKTFSIFCPILSRSCLLVICFKLDANINCPPTLCQAWQLNIQQWTRQIWSVTYSGKNGFGGQISTLDRWVNPSEQQFPCW